MTIKQELHKIIETLSDEEAYRAREWIDRARNETAMMRSPSQTMTPDEFDKRFDEIADLIDPSVPPLSDYAVSRESIYD